METADEAPGLVTGAMSSVADVERPSMDAVKATHGKLTGYYRTALAKVSTLNRTVKGQAAIADFQDSDASAFLVRLMIRTHIRHRLHALAVGYVQLIPVVESSAERAWLAQATTDCEQIVETLPRIQLRPLVLALVAPAAAAISKLPGLPEWLVGVMLGLAGAAPTLLIVGFFTVRNSYRFKRLLLLPKAGEIDKLDVLEQENRLEGNVYHAENEAFKAIGHGKRLEREIDRLLIDLALLFTAEALCFAPIFLHHYQWAPLIGAAATFSIYLLLSRRRRKRVWR